jgi:hypothetical protein
MRRTTPRKANRLAMQSLELAFAVPQVIAHRSARMLAAGARPTIDDQQEIFRMGSEKFEAFTEAWTAMSLQAVNANQRLMLAMLRSWWTPWIRLPFSPLSVTRRSTRAAQRRLQHAGIGLLSAAVAPVHRRAIANAKRLQRRRSR